MAISGAIAKAYVAVEAKLASGFKGDIKQATSQTGDEAAGSFSDAFGGKAAKGMGAALIKGLGALGIASAVAAAFADALEREKSSDKLAASLGLSEAESKRAGGIAGKLYAGAYGENLDEVNTALRGIQDNIGDLGSFSNKQLESMGAKALDLSSIMDEDVGRVTRGVGQLMKNDLAPNASAAFDIITRATQEGGNRAGDLLDTIEEYSPSFRELGFSGEEALGAVTAALDNGARSTDLAADAIKEFSIRAIDGSESTREGFKLLGLDADDMASKIAQGGPTAKQAFTTVIQELGKIRDPVKREAAGVALFGTQFEDMGWKAIQALDPTRSKLDEVDGAAKRMGDTLNDNASTKIEAFKRGLATMATNVIGGVVLPALEDAWGGAQKLGQGLVESAGGADTMRTRLSTAFGAIRQLAQQVWPQISGVIKTAFEIIRTIVQAGVDFIEGIWQRNGQNLINHAKNYWNALRQVFDGAIKAIRGVLEVVLGLIQGDWQRVWNGIKTFLSGVWNVMLGTVKAVFTTIRATVGTILAAIQTLWSNEWNRISTFLRNTWNTMRDAVRTVFQAVSSFISSTLDAISRAWSTAWNAIRTTLSNIWETIKTTVRNAINNVKDTITNIVTSIGTWFNTWKFVFQLAWTNMMEKLRTTVRDKINAVVTFFKELPSRIADAVKNLGSTIKEKVQDILSGIKATINIGAIFSGDGVGILGQDSYNGLNPQLRGAAARIATMGGRVSSGFRPGSITSTGNLSYHARGRAIDIVPPSMALFNRIRAAYPNATELIYTPAGGRQLWHGQPHVFTGGSIQADHYDHIHLALRQGILSTFRNATRFVAGEAGPEDVLAVPHRYGGISAVLDRLGGLQGAKGGGLEQAINRLEAILERQGVPDVRVYLGDREFQGMVTTRVGATTRRARMRARQGARR